MSEYVSGFGVGTAVVGIVAYLTSSKSLEEAAFIVLAGLVFLLATVYLEVWRET